MERISAAYRRGDLMLVLGAGCSLSSSNFLGDKLMTGPSLSEKLCSDFGLNYDGESLPETVQSILADTPKLTLNEHIAKLFSVKLPGPEYVSLANLHIRRFYSLNIDDALENALRKHSQMQTSVLRRNDSVRDPDVLFQRTQVIKLHGCVTRPEDGYVFALSDYDSAHGALPLWYSQLAADCLSNTVAFVGTQANEPLLFDAISRMETNAADPKGFLIVPDLSAGRQRIVASRGLTWIPGTFSQLVDHLRTSGCFEVSAIDIAKSQTPAISAFLAKETDEQTQILSRIQDIIPVKYSIQASHSKAPAGIRPFYEGYRANPKDYDDLVPADLEQIEQLVKTITSAYRADKKLVVITGAAGTGKVTGLHLGARKIANKFKEWPAFLLRRDAPKPLEAVQAVSALYKSKILVFVESLFEARDTIREILLEKHISNILIVAAEPSNSWNNIISQDFDPAIYSTLEFSKITESDAKKILEKLEKFGPWTILSRLSPDERIATILDKSNKQLLVGLLEATRGRGFTEIIRQDFESLGDADCKFLMAVACLCTMFGRGVPVDVAIRAFREKFPDKHFTEALGRLDGAARINSNFLEARHQVYATSVFDTLLSPEEKFDAIYATLLAFSAYGSPVPLKVSRDKSRIFKGIFNYRFLFRTFENHKLLVLSMFQQFETVFHSDGAYWLQYGLALRKFGEHKDALKMMERSVDAYPSSFSQHALGLQFFILADQTPSKGEKRDYLERACRILRSIEPDIRYDDSYPITTLTRGHIATLVRMGDLQEAREKAKMYMGPIEQLQKRKPRDRFVQELLKNLMVLTATEFVDEAYWVMSAET